jgi:hypothetical protein
MRSKSKVYYRVIYKYYLLEKINCGMKAEDAVQGDELGAF